MSDVNPEICSDSKCVARVQVNLVTINPLIYMLKIAVFLVLFLVHIPEPA